MKTLYKFFLFISIFHFVSCEEVIDIELDTAAPRLVVDASLEWAKGTDGSTQTIYLSTTTAFFADAYPKVSGALVQVSNTNNQTFLFSETEPGVYQCNNFVPEIDMEYTLQITYQGEVFEAKEIMMKTPSILNVEQNNNAGILQEDIEVKFFFQDIVNETNFYKEKYEVAFQDLPIYRLVQDRFQANNLMFGNYFNEKLEPGQEITFTLTGVSQRHYNYLRVLLSVAGSSSGSPFQAPPGTVRGNLINKTNPNNFALGYFYAGETDKFTYTIQNP